MNMHSRYRVVTCLKVMTVPSRQTYSHYYSTIDELLAWILNENTMRKSKKCFLTDESGH